MNAQPLAHGRLLAGAKLEKPQTLNGAAGADTPRVEANPTRECPNRLLLTDTRDGKRRSFVWGDSNEDIT